LGYADYRGLAEINARYMWTFFAKHYLQKPDQGGRLLDVGCATGAFLAEAQRSGWTCTGLELSSDAVKVARGEFGVNALQGDLSTGALTPDSFDFVTMWHVLEHLIDPADAIRRVTQLLVSGGKLYIELPNWNSLGRVAKGAAWSQLRPPEHINFFTPRSLIALVSGAGLRVARCSTAYPSLRDKARVRRVSKPLHVFVAGIAMLAESLGRGGYIRLLAEKT
jgi:2-polyprenyl-3-methyl-5-hydroxy-6-metoxy-1,4-benzoquinol methylase